MKIINYYDLMNEIDIANNGYDLKRIILKSLKLYALMNGCYLGTNLISGSDTGMQIVRNLMSGSGGAIMYGAVLSMKEKNNKDENEHLALLELERLAFRLAELNVHTTSDLLKKSEVMQTDYKVALDEQHLPIVEQSKYILIPSYDTLGDIKSSSILQEHNIGSEEYILSKGSPKRVLNLAPRHNNI